MAKAYAATVKPGHKVSLAKYDPNDTGGLDRAEGEKRMKQLDAELAELQELLYAAGRHSVLLLLQGLDTSGKDGTIKRVLKEVNPAGCHIHAFKAPTAIELAHDFLWRVHSNVPDRGQLGVFNRSQYEDVLIVRVHELVPEQVWRQRFHQINDFERMLSETGTILIKCYLHISKEEQEERLLEREQDVTKAWKLSVQDWIERRSWDRYMEAYDEALTECNTKYAPWHIIPANKKWFRNLAVAQLLVDALRPFKEEWLGYLNELGKQQKLAIEEARAAKTV